MTIGVLALQGDVREHVAVLEGLGETVREVLGREDLDGLSGMILPGGESTTLSVLLETSGLFDPLAAALADGLPVLGTCAGMILLAGTVLGGRADQKQFGVIDLVVRRNGYGRQQASFECDLDVIGMEQPPIHAVFIRAPVIEAVSPDVEVLATLPGLGGLPENACAGSTGLPVICRQGPVLVTSFHPELTGDRRIHQLFVGITKERVGVANANVGTTREER
ncbi:MAG: pyridoxal 5'-phosphate synthase glutaminase subunit PdxT [Acidimicrobiales bacterium]